MEKTPKEKAKELVRSYVYLLQKTDSCLNEKCENVISCQHSWYACEGWLKYAKQCALIAVDEILKVIEDNSLEYDDNYWHEVKQEINKL